MAKCSECGFLAIRHNDTHQLEEAFTAFRDHGETTNSEGRSSHHQQVPVCLMRVVSFAKLLGNDTAKATVAKEIQSDRQCNRFTPWNQGFTPKEHAEMIQQEKLLEWQRERENAAREWEERQARSDKEWREKEASVASSRHRWELILLGLLVPAGGIAAQIASAFIERGDLFSKSEVKSAAPADTAKPQPPQTLRDK